MKHLFKNQVRYWLLGSMVVLTVTIGSFSWRVNSVMQAFRMTNQVSQEIRSPDGKYVATLAYSDGPTFGYYFVALQPAADWHHLQPNDPIPQDEVAEVAAEGLNKITWAGNDKLVVSYDVSSNDKAQFMLRKKTWHDVRLVYRGS